MGTVFKAMNKRVDSAIGEEATLAAEDLSGHGQDTVDQPEFDKRAAAPTQDEGDLDYLLETDIKDGDIEKWDQRLLEVTAHSPLISEGIRRLRNQILHPAENRKIKSILFTSAVPGEGKSFICANLAVSLAQGVEKHAIMVDCDLRRPSLAAYFGVSNDRGIVDYLYHDADLAKLIRKTGQPKLSIIPSGPPPVNPAEIVDSKKMAAVINELAERYSDRLLLLDSPPALAAAETPILAKQVDGIVIVVRWGLAGREQVKELVDIIGREKIIGIVFNAFEMNKLEEALQKVRGYEGYYKYIGSYYKT